MSPASSLFVTLGILLSFSVVSQCQNYKSFMEKHIVQEKASINCNITIKDRNLRNRDECRRRNTFIHDTNGKQVREMCSNIVASEVVVSENIFKLTDCKLQRGSPNPPRCGYSQTSENGVIHITCENHYPVHFVTYKSSFGVSWPPCALTVLVVFLLTELLK
ncbi:amphinase-1-like [Pelodytes ibericus]